LGKAELDLSLFTEKDFNMLILPLKDCQYENSFIEVGLKGGVNVPKSPVKLAANLGESLNEKALVAIM
jgi:hypothetical protein